MILFTAEGLGLGRKHNYADNLSRKPFFADSGLGRKEEIADILGGNQIRWTVFAGKHKLADRAQLFKALLA